MKLPKYPLFTAALVAAMAVQVLAQTPPNPQPDPGAPINIFYGAIPPNANNGPVIIFIHGLGSNASFWWTTKAPNPYTSAYAAGYRTAFISLSLDNAQNTSTVAANATTLQQFLPLILQRYGVSQAYFICHSKGGLDFQQAMMNSAAVRAMPKAVFAVATPNQGAIFAEWIYAGPAVPAGVTPYAVWRTQGTINSTIASIIDSKIASPGMQSIATTQIAPLRQQADAIFRQGQIPFMTITGTKHPPLDLQNPGAAAVLAISGYILDNVITNPTGTGTPIPNDGLVTVPESKLPSAYAFDDASMGQNHIDTAIQSGGLTHGRLDALEAMITGFKKVATGGFGSDHNTWAWSMRWFGNALYVGTGREMQCVTLATAAATGGPSYPGTSGCVPDPANLSLQAEIWRYSTGTGWNRVYQSPADIPVQDMNGNTVMTAEELGIRNISTFIENAGTPQAQAVLYAGGVSGNCIFGRQPEYAGNTYPAPRILRSVDGITWTPLPNPPGTFLGDLTLNGGLGSGQTPDITVVSFRSFETFNGQLHAVVTNLRGEGFVVASDTTPWLGGNHWRRVSPSLLVNFTPHVWALKAFNGFLYAPGGNRSNITAQTAGYTVYKTDGSTAPDGSGFYNWVPVILFGGFQIAASQVQSPVALTVEVSNNMLYVGTNRRTELIRIHPGDTWDVVVGYPRQVPNPGEPYSSYSNCPDPNICSVQCVGCPNALGATGDLKRPISGFMNYFNNTFNAHFWQLRESSSGLYLATYDESVQVQQSKTINPYFNAIMGTDLLQTPDAGQTWNQIGYNGMYDGANFGGRSTEKTPIGFFIGMARNAGGTQIYQNASVLDLNKDGFIDNLDVGIVTTAALSKTIVAPGDVRDLDGDGKITSNDARILATQCTFAGCGSPTPNLRKNTATISAPTKLVASPGAVPVAAGTLVQLTWTAVSGAMRYHVYRMTQLTLGDLLQNGPPNAPTTFTVDIPGYGPATIADVQAGKLDPICKLINNSWCDLIPTIKAYNNPSASTNTLIGFPSAPVEVAVVRTNSYSETAPTTLQSNYWVRAEDANGNLTGPSNMVGAPSLWIAPQPVAAVMH